jgi:hypothetical protein
MIAFETQAATSPGGKKTIPLERRSDRRYNVTLKLYWKLIRRKRVLETGAGITLDLSSGGILFEAGRALPSGGKVELYISWPVRLHNAEPLQLVATGRIVRAAGTQAAIRMDQHQFCIKRPDWEFYSTGPFSVRGGSWPAPR